eukprot:1134590-Pelagomonas_calceolata.AAC.1
MARRQQAAATGHLPDPAARAARQAAEDAAQNEQRLRDEDELMRMSAEEQPRSHAPAIAPSSVAVPMPYFEIGSWEPD